MSFNYWFFKSSFLEKANAKIETLFNTIYDMYPFAKDSELLINIKSDFQTKIKTADNFYTRRVYLELLDDLEGDLQLHQNLLIRKNNRELERLLMEKVVYYTQDDLSGSWPADADFIVRDGELWMKDSKGEFVFLTYFEISDRRNFDKNNAISTSKKIGPEQIIDCMMNKRAIQNPCSSTTPIASLILPIRQSNYVLALILADLYSGIDTPQVHKKKFYPPTHHERIGGYERIGTRRIVVESILIGLSIVSILPMLILPYVTVSIVVLALFCTNLALLMLCVFLVMYCVRTYIDNIKIDIRTAFKALSQIAEKIDEYDKIGKKVSFLGLGAASDLNIEIIRSATDDIDIRYVYQDGVKIDEGILPLCLNISENRSSPAFYCPELAELLPLSDEDIRSYIARSQDRFIALIQSQRVQISTKSARTREVQTHF